jgi:hypothetical protein
MSFMSKELTKRARAKKQEEERMVMKRYNYTMDLEDV